MSEIIDESKKIAGIMDLDLYLTDEELLAKDQEHYYQKGLEQRTKEIVINMYNDNLPIEKISKYINLSIAEVNNIIDNNL